MCTEHANKGTAPCITPAGNPRRRAVTLQCNPAVAGLAVLAALVLMSAAEIRQHETGILQALRGAAAGALTLAVVAGLHAMARWVTAQDAPREPVIPLVLDQTAVMIAEPAQADDAMAAMAADADALRDGRLDMVFTAGGNLFELDDSLADEDVT